MVVAVVHEEEADVAVMGLAYMDPQVW